MQGIFSVSDNLCVHRQLNIDPKSPAFSDFWPNAYFASQKPPPVANRPLVIVITNAKHRVRFEFDMGPTSAQYPKNVLIKKVRASEISE
jgi:hypothetical protein